MFREDAYRRFCGERHAAGEHLVSQHTERVDIRAMIDSVTLALLGRHELRRSYDEDGIRGVLLTSKRLGDAEVEDQVGRHENVGGLDVTMNDVATMCGVERLGYLADHFHHTIQRPRLSRELVSQGCAIGHVLHDEIGPTLVLASIVNGKNVRMVETTEELGLLPESPHPVFVAYDLTKDHLDGALTLQSRMEGFLDLGRVSSIKERQYSVSAYLLSDELQNTLLTISIEHVVSHLHHLGEYLSG